MESLKDVMNRISNTRMELTSETCLKHEVFSNGKTFANEITKIKFGGEIVCPLCENEKETIKLQTALEDNVKNLTRQKNHKVFSEKSIISDTDLYDASFATYEVSKPEEVENKKKALNAYNRYAKAEVFNTWLAGLPGVGKSHLAMSILRYLNELGDKDKSCLFVSVEEMIRLIRDSFNNKDSKYTEQYFIDLLSSVDYLALDDLGAETGGVNTDKIASDFTLRVLYAIANARQNKSTIITTNLSRAALIRMYDPKLVSRLMKNTLSIAFKETEDKRIKNIDF